MDHHAPPLSGIRVVDLTASVAGMTAAMLLADLGADVLRFDDGDGDRLPGEVMWHRNKRVTSRDPDAERDAVRGCDVLVTTDDDARARWEPVLRDVPHVIHLDMPTVLPEEGGALVHEVMLGAVTGAGRPASPERATDRRPTGADDPAGSPIRPRVPRRAPARRPVHPAGS